MILQGTILAAMAVLAAAAFAACYAALRRSLVHRQQLTQHQLESLAAKVMALELNVAQLRRAPLLQPVPAPEVETPGAAPVSETAMDAPSAFENHGVNRLEEEVTPEMMGVLAAAVTAYLGRKVRVLSARRLESPRQGMSPWSQQGRVFVQASHNLRSRS